MVGKVDTTFNYNANFGPVINQMRQLMSQANYLNQTLQNFDKQASALKMSLGDALSSDIGKLGGWNTKVIELSDSVGQFGKALEKQELSLKQYAKEGIMAFSSASNAHKLAVREVSREMSQLAVLGEKNGKRLGMMITPTNINLNDMNTKLAVSRKQFDIFNTLVQDGATKLINFGKNTQWAGRQITVGLTVPLATWGNQVSKIFREVNTELTRFQKVYGSGLMSSGDAETIKMTENVKQLGVEFSRTMGIAVKDTASLAAELAATGLEGQKLINALKETTRLSVLGDVSAQDSMKTTLSLQNAFKTSTEDLAHSVDFLNAVENQTSLSLSDLTTAIPKAGPVIKALGGDVKDLSLLMVALKEGGISAAEGANAIKSGMASLINPTKKASDTARQYGIDINGIVQANRGQLMPTIIEFQKQLQLLDDFGKAQVIENVFGKYQFARISALFDNLNASSSQTMQVMDLMGKSQKELAANSYLEMDTLMNSGAKRFQRATESIKAQFIDIGGSITAAITPIIENVSSKIGKVIKFFDKLPAPVKSFIKVATGLAAIAGPIIMIAGVFSNFLGYITKGAMSIVNLGRRMAGIPVEKFKMLDDTQIMAQKSTDALSQAFDLQATSVEKLNQVLAIYKKNLSEAITLNPGFLNQQVAAQTTSGKPPKAKFQAGGSTSPWVPGSGDGDKIPALLEPGEYVVNKKAASQHSAMLDNINFNKAPRFQTGGRINAYNSNSYYGDAKFNEQDLQNALKSWISPTLTGLRPFNDPLKPGGYEAFGEKYRGFFADIFKQSTVPLENQHLMRAAQYEKGKANWSPMPKSIMEMVMLANQGRVYPPILNYANAPYYLDTTRYTSFSDIENTEFYKRFLPMFGPNKTTKAARAKVDKIFAGDLFPYILDVYTGKGNNISGIPVSKMLQGDYQWNNESETVIPGGTRFPITGYGSDLKTRMLMLHSVFPGATKNINGREVPLAQRGGRIQSADMGYHPMDENNRFIPADVEKQMTDPKYLASKWTDYDGMRGIRSNLKQYNALWDYSHQSVPEGTRLVRGTVINSASPEFIGSQAAEIINAINSGNLQSLIGKPINLRGIGSWSADPENRKYPVSKFLNNSWGNLFDVEKLKAQGNTSYANLAKGLMKQKGLSVGKEGFKPATLVFTSGKKTTGRSLHEVSPLSGEWLLTSPNGIITSAESIAGKLGSLANTQIEIQGLQRGGRIRSADSGMSMEDRINDYTGGLNSGNLFDFIDKKEKKKFDRLLERVEDGEYFVYKEKLMQKYLLSSFEGKGRGLKDQSIYQKRFVTDFLQTSLDTLLPNATGAGSSEEQKYQLNVLKRYMKMFNITDISQLSPGMQATLFDAFAIHRSRDKITKALPMGKYSEQDNIYGGPLEGPGTYLSSSLRVSDTKWSGYSGDLLYRPSKTRDVFRKIAKSKGYLNWENIDALLEQFQKTKKGKDYEADGIDEYTTPDDPFIKYLISLGYIGADFGAESHTNWLIGQEGYGLKSFKPTKGKVGYQTGGRIQSASEGLQSILEQWQESPGLVRSNPEMIAQILSAMSPIQQSMTLRRKTELGVPGEMPESQQIAILKAIQTGDFSELMGQKFSFSGDISSYTEKGFDWLAGKAFVPSKLSQMFFRQEQQSHSLKYDQSFIQAYQRWKSSEAGSYEQSDATDTLIRHFMMGKFDPSTRKQVVDEEKILLRISQMERNRKLEQEQVDATRPFGFDPRYIMLQRQFQSGTPMLGVSQASPQGKSMGRSLDESEWLAGAGEGILQGVAQSWAPPSRFGSQEKYDQQKMHMPFILDFKQRGGRIQSAASLRGPYGKRDLGKPAFAHIVSPRLSPSGLVDLTAPFGLMIPGQMNSDLDKGIKLKDGIHGVPKQDLFEAFNNKDSDVEMANYLNIYGEKNAESIAEGIRSRVAKSVKASPLSEFRDPDVYKITESDKGTKNLIDKFFKQHKYYDVRTRVTREKLAKVGYKLVETRKDQTEIWQKGKQKYIYDPSGNHTDRILDINGNPVTNTNQVRSMRRSGFSMDQLKPLEKEIAGFRYGGRVQSHAEDSMIVKNEEGETAWKGRAAAPKQYQGLLAMIPGWESLPAESLAIAMAIAEAGIPESKLKYYLAPALAHIVPKSTYDGTIYTKIWESANLMKDLSVYNSFLETVRSRGDIQRIGGITAPSVVDRVAQLSGLSREQAAKELQDIQNGIHPHTRPAAMAMLALAQMFPSKVKGSEGLPIATAAGLMERLKGNFYETLESRQVPPRPTVKVVVTNPNVQSSQSQKVQKPSTGSGKIIYPSMAGGTGTKATVNVSPDGQILSSTIDDMLVTSVTGQPLAVSSRELLAVTPDGRVAGVTSPGDESRKRIVHPIGTSLIRGKNFRVQAHNQTNYKPDAPGEAGAIYETPIEGGSMAKFVSAISSMSNVTYQLKFAFEAFTSEVNNGAQKWLASINLGVEGLKIFSEHGMGTLGKALKSKGDEMSAEIYDIHTRKEVNSPTTKFAGKALSGIGSAMGKVAGALGNPLVQMGLSATMAAVTKAVEMYNAAMEKARKAGNAAFAEPTETAKLMGVQLKSLNASSERYGKALKEIYGEQGRGAYDKAFEKTVKTDFGDLIDTLKDTSTEQEKVNQLTNTYTNLIQRGMDPAKAKEVTAEIARQSQSLTAFNSNPMNDMMKRVKDSKAAAYEQINTLNSQMDILEKRRKLATTANGKDILQGGLSAINPFAGPLGGERSAGQILRADTLNKAIFGNNQNKWWAKALTGTGLDRNPLAQVIGGWLADKEIKTQTAAQIGATLKQAFAAAADNPSAAIEVTRAVLAEFKNADWGKLKTEIGDILKEKGIGDTSQVFAFATDDKFKNMAQTNQSAANIFFQGINAGFAPKFEEIIKKYGTDGLIAALQPDSETAGKIAKQMALVKIDTEVDLQIDDSMKQLDLLKKSVQDVFAVAIEAKQAELEAEDKRHEKALENLDDEAAKLNKKKEQLQENTDYYLKELQREKDAEDYYAKQRETALGGLRSIASGDVFGFIGAQAQAASQADQFGRDRSMQNIQETADEEQKKLDDALKGIDDRKAAEDARHQAEIDHINAEIELLRKKEAVSIGKINEADALLEKAKNMTPGSKGYAETILKAQSLVGSARLTAMANIAGIELAPGTDKDLIKGFNKAKGDFKDAIDIMAKDIANAVTILNNSGKIAGNVYRGLNIDPKYSEAYISVFQTLQKPLDPTVSEAIQTFFYQKPDYATDTEGKDIKPPKISYVKPEQTIDIGDGFIYKGTLNDDGTIKWQRKVKSDNTYYAYADAPEAPKDKNGQYYEVRKASGGYISGPGTSTSDSIPARLSDGEYVIRASAVRKYGRGLLDDLNAQKFADGGMVGDMPHYGLGGFFSNIKNRAIGAIEFAKKNPMQALKNGLKAYGRLQLNGAKFIVNNFLGVDDFVNTYKHIRKGEYGAAFKSLGQGVFELGTTAAMFVPGLQGVAIAGKLANTAKIASVAGKTGKLATVGGIIQGAKDLAGVLDIATGAFDLIKGSRALSRFANYGKVSSAIKKVSPAFSNLNKIGGIGTLNNLSTIANAEYNYIRSGRQEDLATYLRSTALLVASRGKIKVATGGHILGPGTSTSDSIPAMLSNGEYVMNANAVKRYGVPFMNDINVGRFAAGGGVGVMPTTNVPSSPTYSIPSTPSINPASIPGLAQGGSIGDMSSSNAHYNFNFNGAGMDMVMGHVNKALGGTIGNNSRGVYG